MKETREWEMVDELFTLRDELKTDAQYDFIVSLHENLDPYEPFEDQLIGTPESVENQIKWLYYIYEKVANENEDIDWEDFDE